MLPKRSHIVCTDRCYAILPTVGLRSNGWGTSPSLRPSLPPVGLAHNEGYAKWGEKNSPAALFPTPLRISPSRWLPPRTKNKQTMNLIPIILNNRRISVNDEIGIEGKTFKEIGVTEFDIEDFLKNNAEEVFEDENLFIIGQQVANTSKGITDLVAIDENGNIVLIEIKRDRDDIKRRREKFEYQAIRYAAGLAKISTPIELVDQIFSKFIENNKTKFNLGELTARELGLRLINEFLFENDAKKSFNKKQRIILIASEFDRQTESAVAWLISNNVDISCFTIKPIEINNKLYLRSERLLPPPTLEDFYVNVASNTYDEGTEIKTRVVRSTLPKMDKLFDWGIIKKGELLYIKNRKDHKGIAIDSKYVDVNGEKITYHEWGKIATGWSSVQTYAMIVKEESGKTLSELRREKMKEVEMNEGENL